MIQRKPAAPQPAQAPQRSTPASTPAGGGSTRLPAWSAVRPGLLRVLPASDPAEQQARQVATEVTSGSGLARFQPAAATAVALARDEKPPESKSGAEPAAPAEEPKVGFGSPALPWLILKPLVLKFPSRWKSAAELTASKMTKDDRELYYNTTVALHNLLYAGMFTQMSAYKPDWSKALATAEGLSGVTDTYLKLASFAIQKDIEKYLGEEAVPTYKENLGWLILYGLFLQGGLVGMNAALEKDLDFTTLVKPAVKKWTEAPAGFGRPFQLGNTLDPRWSQYPFWTSPSGFESGITGFEDPTKPYTFKMKLGVNVASLADLYPEKEEDKKKYKGFELYPYFTLSHAWSKEGGPPPELKNIWLAGLFFGGEGIYTLVEGGQKQKADETVAETYLRSGLVLRNLGALSLGQFTQEYSLSPGGDLRTRLNAATSIRIVDNKTWQSSFGLGVGGLLPAAGKPGSVDLGGELSLYHKTYRPGTTEPFKTGASLGTTWRGQEPFDPQQGRLFSVGGKLSVLDLLVFSAEYHRIQQETPTPGQPTQDFRFMLFPGPGIFRW